MLHDVFDLRVENFTWLHWIDTLSHLRIVHLERICVIYITKFLQLRLVRILTFITRGLFEFNLLVNQFPDLFIMLVSDTLLFKLVLFLISCLL